MNSFMAIKVVGILFWYKLLLVMHIVILHVVYSIYFENNINTKRICLFFSTNFPTTLPKQLITQQLKA